jgi:glycopeptide antibiotics resistance protein
MYNTLKVIDCEILAAVYIFYLLPRYKHAGKASLLFHTLLYVYVCVVLYLTLLPLVPTFDRPSINLVPFRDYINAYGDYEKQILYNILLFIPMGIFIPWFRDTGFRKTVFCCFLISLAIEILQPWVTLYRVCDVTDLITNTAGAVIGYGFYLILKKPLSHLREESRKL